MLTIGAIGRYHYFEQARALYEAGQLRQLVSDYPLARMRRTGIPAERLKGLPWLAPLRLIPPSVHGFGWAGAMLARQFASENDLVKVNSAFALESIRAGLRVIVDHGSLHERTARRFYHEEAERIGLPISQYSGNHSFGWLMDRQDEEFARAESVLVLSELARQSMLRQGVPDAKIQVSWPGVDVALFQRCERTARRPFRVVQVSSLTPKKGIHLALDAWKKVGGPDAELLLLGAGNPPSGLPHCVTRQGPVPQHQLPEWLSTADLFILPSLADGFGLVVLQAMACELPVIVSAHCGAAEAVSGQPYARVIPAGNADSLAEAIEEFRVLGRDARRDLGRLARKDACARFLWSHHAARLIEQNTAAFPVAAA